MIHLNKQNYSKSRIQYSSPPNLIIRDLLGNSSFKRSAITCRT